MGANAQTTVPDFVADTVLTAAKLDISAATGVPVFATTVTRDAAFGGVNKVLAEGQTCYLESTNVVQYYDGAAWATVGPTAAPTSGLVVVKAETAFGPVSTVTADGVFTSSYTNYEILISWTGSTGVVATCQLRVGGTPATTNYNWQRLICGGGSVTAARGSSQSTQEIGNSRETPTSTKITLFNPQLAEVTRFLTLPIDNEGLTLPVLTMYNGNHSTTTAYDGIGINFGTSSTGTYTIYGYGKTL